MAHRIFDSDDEVRVLQGMCQTATQRGWAVACNPSIRGAGDSGFLHLQGV